MNIKQISIRDIKVGKDVSIIEPSNLYECELGDNVFVGPFCEIQNNVKIDKNTRIQSHTFICALTQIGKDCFIGHGVMFVNDLFKNGKPSKDSSFWKGAIIENNVSIGSNATILPVKICSNVVIGAGSVVTKDILKPGIYAGNPATLIRELNTENKQNIVFGPILSRRFGLSLGVDLSPTKKQCNFDCVYCELKRATPLESMQEVIPAKTIINAIDSALKSDVKCEVLTISANGEPTLYPYLDEVISEVKKLPSFKKRNIKTLILSNGSRLMEQKNALNKFDIVKFSIDSVIPKYFNQTDRPNKNLNLESIKNGIKEFSKQFGGELVAEILIVKGLNDSDENLKSIGDFLREIKVSRVDLGSVDRPSAYHTTPVSSEFLNESLKFFNGLCVSLPKRENENKLTKKHYSKKDILKIIATRPIELNEAKLLFSQENLATIQELLESKILSIKKSGNLTFYVKD